MAEVQLRPYQLQYRLDLYDWFEKHETGNPCLVLSTGGGKSHIVADICRDALHNWPETRILMLTHRQELIQQNLEKLLQHWPGAPVGIYSAGLRRKQLGDPITFAGIDSIRKKADDIGHVDLILIDEAHMVNHKNAGGYRTLINELHEINPHLRVIGLTASPFRMGHGLITDDPAIFDDLIESITCKELIDQGFLSVLRSKCTNFQQDTSGVKKRGGEFIESELFKALDTEDQNQIVVKEIIDRAENRRHWLLFCSGVAHAEHIRDLLIESGISAKCVTGETPPGERAQMLADFKAGKIKALTNCDVLTTGFDFPDIDLIAMLRPTMSPGLYLQMAGRGLRLKSHTDHCLVLDFAGNVATHGPITDVQPPKKGSKGDGKAPTKTCESCAEICHAAVRFCPACGHPFPAPEIKPMVLRNDDIMGLEPLEMDVSGWQWYDHESMSSGKHSLKIRYYGPLGQKPVDEFLCVVHGGKAGQIAQQTLAKMMMSAGVEWSDGENTDRVILTPKDLPIIAEAMSQARPPDIVKYRKEGKFYRVLSRHWDRQLEIDDSNGYRKFIHTKESEIETPEQEPDTSAWDNYSYSQPVDKPVENPVIRSIRDREFTAEELEELPF